MADARGQQQEVQRLLVEEETAQGGPAPLVRPDHAIYLEGWEACGMVGRVEYVGMSAVPRLDLSSTPHVLRARCRWLDEKRIHGGQRVLAWRVWEAMDRWYKAVQDERVEEERRS